MAKENGRFIEVFFAFFKLGMTSFGGPAAHIGYFRTRFVEQLKWLDEQTFALYFSTSQSLPGPSSSQLGYAIGTHRAGLTGGLAAFLGFTLPSACLMLLFAIASHTFDTAWTKVLINACLLLTVVVVCDAVMSMFKALCPDNQTKITCMTTTGALVVVGPSVIMILVVLAISLSYALYSHRNEKPPVHSANFVQREKIYFASAILKSLSLIVLLFFIGWLFWPGDQERAIPALITFFQSGALVFGGGHVVLPLLEPSLVDSGWISKEIFFNGYGLAQVVPGPLFSIAAYYGYFVADQNMGIALLCMIALFLPGLALMHFLAPISDRILAQPRLNRVVKVISAASVGVLAAALIITILPKIWFSLESLLGAIVLFIASKKANLNVLSVAVLALLWTTFTHLVLG